ncbi:YraN family protein [Paenibacillus rigui]|uniref:UPF0102 protein CF651_19295 n=1 Tax=Paenibacillus rigui TaxID=554312 RepID=A0A229UMQ1_9BACL|nr:YraN family protein [Paenibacillus rigui]OXM84652.1 YraN family protein [Paenibacillus rigui]
MSESILTRKQLGELGERLAAAYLEQNGYQIHGRNWRCRTGEIDIIAMEGKVLVFVEVRTRSGRSTFGTPQESVNYKKQLQVMETAQWYIHRFQLQSLQPRFDVVSVLTDKAGQLVKLDHIQNAF